MKPDRLMDLVGPFELLRRTILQGAMRMHEVVIGKPSMQLCKHRGGIGCRVNPHVVTLEGFHERLGHAIALWRAVRRASRYQADVLGKGAGVSSECSPSRYH